MDGSLLIGTVIAVRHLRMGRGPSICDGEKNGATAMRTILRT